jgi:GNAT superfamily N-acetyltransferase
MLLSRMDSETILRLLDNERQTLAYPGAVLETARHIVRELSANAKGIAYSCLSAANAEQVIDQELARFRELGAGFEWKVYSHDQPPDLLARLLKRGFKIGDQESVMISDLTQLPETLFVPPRTGIEVKRVSSGEMVDDVLAVEMSVWQDSHLNREDLVASLSDPLESDIAFVAYSGVNPIGFGRVTIAPDSVFAGLWGGSVLEEFRGLGVYRALLAARIAQARRCPWIRYLRVDALPTSRPILEKYGFTRIAETWPCDFNEDSA